MKKGLLLLMIVAVFATSANALPVYSNGTHHSDYYSDASAAHVKLWDKIVAWWHSVVD